MNERTIPQELDPRTQKIWQAVGELYESSDRKLAQWMWPNHVLFIAHKGIELAARYGANPNLVVKGALLHDLADVWEDRHSNAFDERTHQESEKILQQTSHSKEEIHELLEVIIAPHSCYPGNVPTTIEGKLLATGDALAHLTTNFYDVIFELAHPVAAHEEYPVWVLKKIERDFNAKIFFDEIKAQVEPDYLRIKSKFS